MYGEVARCGYRKAHTRGNFVTLLEDLSLRCTRSEVELFVITTRRLWLRRNDVVHGGCLTHPTQLLTEAMKALDDFQKVNSKQNVEEGPLQTQSIASWKPPPLNMVKINWDAALDHRD
jgi:hypothetical protein